MSNTTSLGDRAICEELSAVQIGSVSKPVQVAYINSVVPTPAESLQNVCDVGNTTTTSITCNGLTAPTGDITATAGDITATAGSIVAGSGISTATGDIIATAGGVVADAGNSSLNRIQYKTYYGGSDAANTVAVAPQTVTPLVAFTMPSDTYQLTLFLTNSQPAAQEFAFEVHGLPSNVLRDYQLHMTAQTYENGGGFSLGFNGIVIGESISDPTNTTKCTCIFNVAQPYAAQKIKCNVRFEYSPTP